MKTIHVFLASALLASGCTATPNQDGSTTIKLSVPGLPLPTQSVQTSNSQQIAAANRSTPVNVPTPTPGATISNTTLSGIFAKHPWNGSMDTFYPKVAISVTDYKRSDCWLANAVIWWSASKSEQVNNFNVCMNQSLGAAINGAAGLHMFMEQSQIFKHTGNVRTVGPKPPQYAISMTGTTPPGFSDFAQQLVAETGWQPGPAEVTMWIVDFKQSN